MIERLCLDKTSFLSLTMKNLYSEIFSVFEQNLCKLHNNAINTNSTYLGKNVSYIFPRNSETEYCSILNKVHLETKSTVSAVHEMSIHS